MSFLDKKDSSKGKKQDARIEAVEATLTRIQKDPTVRGVMVVNADGIIERSTVDVAQANTYMAAARKMILMSRIMLKNLDPRDELSFVRVRTQKTELMIGPDNGYLLIVIQDIEPYENMVVKVSDD